MRKYFTHWYFWATHSRMGPIIKAAKSLKSNIDNIVTYAKHRITNAMGKIINSKIEKVKWLACAYRNRYHYKTAIYFHCGGLDLYPRKKPFPFQVVNPYPQVIVGTHTIVRSAKNEFKYILL